MASWVVLCELTVISIVKFDFLDIANHDQSNRRLHLCRK